MSAPDSARLFVSLFFLVPLLNAGRAAGAGVDDLVAPGAPVRKLASGFRFTEGPAFGPQGFLLFSDIPANQIRKLLPGGSTEVFLEPSDGANGLIFDPAGRLYACQGKARRVVRIEITPGEAEGKKLTALADSFGGKKLNSPNDLALDPQGGVYFTDPRYGGGDPVEQPVMGVYYIDPASQVSRVIDDLKRPNGILVSPDGKRLYVANPDARELYRYAIESPGQLAARKLIFTGDGELDGGGPDGMALDERGNIYATYKGIVVLDPDGGLLGRIAVPEHPANCTFGGPERRTLYITARTSLYAVETKVRGMELLGPKAAAAAGPGAGDRREAKAGVLTLKVPRSWKEIGPDGRMRLNQFEVPAAAEDKEPAELVVYYFGPGGAGGVGANLQRWIGQFSAEGRKVKLTRGKSAAGEYTLADVTGTYQKPIGPPVEGKSKPAPGSRMLAAIVDTSAGHHFLKFTGPEATVSGAADAFRAAFGATAAGEAEYRPGEK